MNPTQLFAAAYAAVTIGELFPLSYLKYAEFETKGAALFYLVKFGARIILLVWAIRVLQGI